MFGPGVAEIKNVLAKNTANRCQDINQPLLFYKNLNNTCAMLKSMRHVEKINTAIKTVYVMRIYIAIKLLIDYFIS